VDRDARALASLDHWPDAVRRSVIPVVADFSRPFNLPSLHDTLLDGMLFANALHFVRDADEVVARDLLGGELARRDRGGDAPRRPGVEVAHPPAALRSP